MMSFFEISGLLGCGVLLLVIVWSDTLKPHTQGDIIKHRKGAADGTKIHGRI